MGLVDKVAGGASFLEGFLEKDERQLLRKARAIDRVDRFLGPLESTLQVYGSPFWAGVGVALEVAELAFMKIPFAYSYLKKTKDYDALYSWLPKEIFATMVPYGDFIDLTSAYHNRVQKFYERKVRVREKAPYANARPVSNMD